jgi:hypothetical protein
MEINLDDEGCLVECIVAPILGLQAGRVEIVESFIWGSFFSEINYFFLDLMKP